MVELGCPDCGYQDFGALVVITAPTHFTMRGEEVCWGDYDEVYWDSAEPVEIVCNECAWNTRIQSDTTIQSHLLPVGLEGEDVPDEDF